MINVVKKINEKQNLNIAKLFNESERKLKELKLYDHSQVEYIFEVLRGLNNESISRSSNDIFILEITAQIAEYCDFLFDVTEALKQLFQEQGISIKEILETQKKKEKELIMSMEDRINEAQKTLKDIDKKTDSYIS